MPREAGVAIANEIRFDVREMPGQKTIVIMATCLQRPDGVPHEYRSD
jgi:hypothetical protein